MTDLLELDAVALAARIRALDVSSEAVVCAYLARIEQVDPVLHAVVATSSGALEEARAVDLARRRGLDTRGALAGVPFTVKDWIEVAGLPCIADQPTRVDRLMRRDATVVTRLRKAGAIVLAKTKAGDSENLQPRPRNPFDPARTAAWNWQ